MTDIFFDESGYTGTDLINHDQPFFVIASSKVGDDDALQILRESFPGYQGAEYKFTNIWRRDRHRRNLERFATLLPNYEDSIFIWGVDKRFCLLTKMIDYVIEPAMYGAGLDFYGNGYARRYAYTVHRDIKLGATDEAYFELVELWDRFARRPTQEGASVLHDFVRAQAREANGLAKSFFNFLAKALDLFIKSRAFETTFEDTNEIQVTSMLSSVIHWRQKLESDLDLFHDQSSNFFRNRSMWQSIVRDDAPEGLHQLGNGSTVQFPLRVSSTQALRSHDSPAIQLCDVLAGLFSKLMPAVQGFELDPFLKDLVIKGAGEITMSGVNPERLYVTGPPAARTGPDALDRMMEIMRPELDRLSSREKRDRDNK